ncbi:hypothetical protein [Pseudobdellovibrio sp. HCB154]|uniref:hypothetical protein n=1 Tax=Pseudobdellovibrio sp. HCB154 TaxID=3386277 RepID=UPI0039170ED1
MNESKQMLSKSSHNCLLCKKQLALHFIGTDIQVESCFPCQKVWFDSEELKKFQLYTESRKDVKKIQLQEEASDVPITQLIFDQTYDRSVHLARHSLGLFAEMGMIEIGSNYAGNKITDTNFFKKYPILTFFLIVAVIILYFMITRD